MARQITVPAGIGDSIWLLQKLINQDEQFDFIIPGGTPRRGKQIFDLLPDLTHSATYSEKSISYEEIKRKNIQKNRNNWSRINQSYFYLSANEWLENGNYLSDFLPDIETSYSIPWATNNHRKAVDKDVKELCIGIYGSSYSTSRSWGFWQEKEWFDLITRIHKERPNATFFLIGAEWDMTLTDSLIVLLRREKIGYVNTTGKPLGYVAELMKRLDYSFYFPSGLPILSETLEGKKDCFMFYPKHLIKMMGKWADPSRIENNQFKEAQFCTPEETFKWVRDKYKLFERI